MVKLIPNSQQMLRRPFAAGLLAELTIERWSGSVTTPLPSWNDRLAAETKGQLGRGRLVARIIELRLDERDLRRIAQPGR